jgi:hypothetical protein
VSCASKYLVYAAWRIDGIVVVLAASFYIGECSILYNSPRLRYVRSSLLLCVLLSCVAPSLSLYLFTSNMTLEHLGGVVSFHDDVFVAWVVIFIILDGLFVQFGFVLNYRHRVLVTEIGHNNTKLGRDSSFVQCIL